MVETRIGSVTHYYGRIGVAVLNLDKMLQVGDTIRIRGHTTDFTQPVISMEIEHQKVQVAEPGSDIAVKLKDRVRRGDAVFKVEE